MDFNRPWVNLKEEHRTSMETMMRVTQAAYEIKNNAAAKVGLILSIFVLD